MFEVEWAIRWEQHIDGYPDLTTYATEEDARDSLEQTSFDGEVVSREVVRGPWTSKGQD